MSTATTKRIVVIGGNLHAIAAQYLGDATQAVRIAQRNGLSDFYLLGQVTLDIPPVDKSLSGGVPTQ